MSKSRGNVVVPDEYIARWGADTFRMYLMSLRPFRGGGDFQDEGISDARRLLTRCGVSWATPAARAADVLLEIALHGSAGQEQRFFPAEACRRAAGAR